MSTTGVINGMVRKLSNMFYMQHNHCGTSCGVKSRWDITQLTKLNTRNLPNYAVLILNRPITQSQEFMKDFWNNASVRITIDGGTVQWDKYINKLPESVQSSMKLPDLITGDFDSISEDVMKKYKNQGCKAVHTPDQNYTDFTKALMELTNYCTQHEMQVDHVVAIGQSSGRLDQILGNIQTLFLAKEKRLLNPKSELYLISDDFISWLLFPGEHIITIPKETINHKRAWCSLVPIGETCQSVTSTGLKWDLDNQPLKFGELVSTSNTFNGSDVVKINCSHTILWSMKVPTLIDAMQ